MSLQQTPASARPRTFCAVSMLVLAAWGFAAADPAPPPISLDIEQVQYTAGAHVTFTAPAGIVVTSTPHTLDDETDHGTFHYYVDLSSLEWSTTGCLCFRHYTFYVQAASGGPIIRFKESATPVGTFPDQLEKVRFTVNIRGVKDGGTTVLPVANGQPMEGAAIVEYRDIQIVRVNGHSTVKVGTQPPPPNTKVVIDTSAAASYDDRLWLTAPEPQPSSRHVTVDSSTGKLDLYFDVQPRPFAAAARSFFSVHSSDENAWIEFPIVVRNAAFTNREAHVVAKVHMHFDPSFWLLLSSLGGGLLTGCLLRLAVPAERRGWPGNSGIAAVAAFAFWIFGAFLVAFGSKFVLFTFELDPWQALPTVIIGLLCGILGAHSVDTVRRMLHTDPVVASPPPNDNRPADDRHPRRAPQSGRN
jgi:hypothetical protein